jgi:hypothetical protein
MKRVILALLVGLAAGYHFGFDDATSGGDSIVSRTLDRFGTSKIRNAQAAQDRRIQDASKP